MLDVMDAFQAYFEGVMGRAYIFRDRFYVDLGKDYPSVGLLPHVPGAVDDEPLSTSGGGATWNTTCAGYTTGPPKIEADLLPTEHAP
jgi:hypothetical protein